MQASILSLFHLKLPLSTFLCLVQLPAGVAVATSESVTAKDGAAGDREAGPETEGACGWSKGQTSLELICREPTDVSKHLIQQSDQVNCCVCGPHLSVHLSADAVRGRPSALVSSPGCCEAPPSLRHRHLHAVSGLWLQC